MPTRMERTFRKEMASLRSVFAFLDTSLATCHADPASTSAISLAVEEIFTNMVRHASEGHHDISIAVEPDGNTLVVSIVDTDVDPFDLTRAAEVDTSLPLDQRRVGGLGIHLVRRLVDDLRYSYANRRSTISFRKRLET